jgi:hypothetical protein
VRRTLLGHVGHYWPRADLDIRLLGITEEEEVGDDIAAAAAVAIAFTSSFCSTQKVELSGKCRSSLACHYDEKSGIEGTLHNAP